jgi:hypothetical protein
MRRIAESSTVGVTHDSPVFATPDNPYAHARKRVYERARPLLSALPSPPSCHTFAPPNAIDTIATTTDDDASTMGFAKRKMDRTKTLVKIRRRDSNIDY